MDEGESATDLKWYSDTHKKYAQFVLAYENQEWSKLQTTRIV